jgi:site-specific DNA-cytosine methylase
MKPENAKNNRKQIVVASIFSGIDLFLFGCIKAGMFPGFQVERNVFAALMSAANFKNPDGSPVIEFFNIAEDEYKFRKEQSDDIVAKSDGEYIRTKEIQEVSGQEIRAAIEAKYGKDVIIILIGGPPCQDFTNMNKKRNTTETGRNYLIFEFLRILEELNPDVALMEEVPDLMQKEFKDIFDQFISTAQTLPYQFASQEMCSLHYGGRQLRWRCVLMFVRNGYKTGPIFPTPDAINVKRVRDFLDIDYFISTQFNGGWKYKDHFMCTLTSGDPSEFVKDGKRFAPSIDDLLLCFDVEKGGYVIPDGIPKGQVRKAIGNAVCASVAYALATTVIDKVLRMRPDGGGYFISIDFNPTGPDDSPSDISQDTSETSGEGPDITPSNGNPVEPDVSAENQVEQKLNLIQSPELSTSANLGIPVSGPAKFYEPGFVLWEGKSLIDGGNIAAILTLKSLNEKTGNMAQLWILTADLNPVVAVKEGKDESVCGKCHFRHHLGGACYVFVGQEPLTVWKAWKNGAYPKLPIQYYTTLTGLPIRFGAYGDPAAIPLNILTELKKYASNNTGYTHQWKSNSASDLKDSCMASVDNPEEYKEAHDMGWRTFRVMKPEEQLLPGEIMCPNLTAGVQCKDCQLCSGNAIEAKNIAIPVHGSRKAKLSQKTTSLPIQLGESPPLKLLSPLRNVCKTDITSKKIDPPKIISSAALQQMEFESLDFDGVWNDLFGYPAVIFHCIIHGRSGHGKSTFAIQLAKYLADNFGNVLYVSGEEGFSSTFKDKFVNNDAGSKFLDVADLRSFEDIIQVIPRAKYHFIFLDSLDTMKIDANKMRKIKSVFSNATLVTISQATKAGQMRGSYEIVHDSDIVVEVINGIAMTTKNRFKKKGMSFNVFQRINPDENANQGISSPEPEELIVSLNKQLEKALAEQNFEVAARLRDQINKINGSDKP